VAERSTFGPVVVIGLASSGLLAVAGHKPMLEVPAAHLEEVGLETLARSGEGLVAEFPLVGALALVTLACWGVLLVARGRARIVVAALAGLAVLGALVTLVVGGFVQDDDAAYDLMSRLGAANHLAERTPIEPTAWFWVALPAAALGLLSAVAAVRLAPTWPQMGSRYDAPTSRRDESPAAPADTPATEKSSIDLWKSLDDGEDPTR
jgi:uncharacterized membrane protein (TIGR02234 family)